MNHLGGKERKELCKNDINSNEACVKPRKITLKNKEWMNHVGEKSCENENKTTI